MGIQWTVITVLATLAGVALGAILNYRLNVKRENDKKHQEDKQLMRSLRMEIGDNRYSCQIMADTGIVNYLKTANWEKIKNSDVVYYHITIKNEELFKELFEIYHLIEATNICIEKIIWTDLDPEKKRSQEEALKGLSAKAVKHLKPLEEKLGKFLIEQGYFSKTD